MNYRAVVTLATREGRPVRVWCEAQRERAPRWWPEAIRAWWMRWRRVSSVKRLVTKRGETQTGPVLRPGMRVSRPVAVPRGWRGTKRDGRLYVPLYDEQDMQRWLRRIGEAGA